MIDVESKFPLVELEAEETWEAVELHLAELEQLESEMPSLLKTKRVLLEDQSYREMELLSEQRGKHSDMGVGRFEEHMRVQKRRDEKLKGIRDGLTGCQSEIDKKEYRIKVLETSLRVKASRLEELGGMLHCFAAYMIQSHKPENPKTPNKT